MAREPTTPEEPAPKPWEDPEWKDAVAEVDETLLHWFLSLTPLQRIQAGTRADQALRRFLHERPADP